MSRWTDQYVEEWIGNLLRVGVTLAAAVVLFGGSVYLLRHGREVPQFNVFKGEPTNLRTVPGIVKDVLAFRGRGMIQLGLLLLIATPVARVAFSVVLSPSSVTGFMSWSRSLSLRYWFTAWRVGALR